MKPALQWPLAAVLVTAAFFSLRAGWIPVKAEVAQLLLERAWVRVRLGDTSARPWPWADTSPAGILEVPDMGIRQIVLAGNSGRNLAFGPTLQTASDWGDVMMSGHRDTHFSFMKSLKKDELLRFTTTQGTREYRVSWLEVIDTRHQELVLEPQVDRLTLTTCYPFDTVTAGGPLRYVVTARPVNAGSG